MNAQTRKRIMKHLHDFKSDLVVLIKSSEISTHSNEKEEYVKMGDEAEKMIMDHPIYKQILKKQHNADHGTYFSKVEYAPEERSFMKTDANYLKMMECFDKEMSYDARISEEFAYRLKNGNPTPEEKAIFDGAEIKIWENSDEFFRDGEYSGFPMITFDSVYYEILNGYWGNLGDRFTESLNEKLEAEGYSIEPYDYSTWVIVKN